MHMIIFETMFKDLNTIKKYVDEKINDSRNKDCIESEYDNEQNIFIYKCKNKFRKQIVFELFEKIQTKRPGNICLTSE